MITGTGAHLSMHACAQSNAPRTKEEKVSPTSRRCLCLLLCPAGNIVLFSSSTFGKAKGRGESEAYSEGQRLLAAWAAGQAGGHESGGGAPKGPRALPSLSVYSDADADADGDGDGDGVQVRALIKGRVVLPVNRR